MSESIWVAELRISKATARKISGRHRIEEGEVREAVECVSGLRFTWDDDPERGLRAIVEVGIRGEPRLVVLYPVEHPMGDVWNLGSVYDA